MGNVSKRVKYVETSEKSISTIFQVLQAPESWSKYTTGIISWNIFLVGTAILKVHEGYPRVLRHLHVLWGAPNLKTKRRRIGTILPSQQKKLSVLLCKQNLIHQHPKTKLFCHS